MNPLQTSRKALVVLIRVHPTGLLHRRNQLGSLDTHTSEGVPVRTCLMSRRSEMVADSSPRGPCTSKRHQPSARRCKRRPCTVPNLHAVISPLLPLR